ncbi:MAG: hypothetical protein DMF73_09905 [Acidobacteria bacterium]|nr:MAG: hypothetical protein DMF73_09905 [Acidobacteriota bacterium]
MQFECGTRILRVIHGRDAPCHLTKLHQYNCSDSSQILTIEKCFVLIPLAVLTEPCRVAEIAGTIFQTI